MNPSLVIALLEKYTSLTKADAEKLAKELDLAIQPSTYKDAVKTLEELLARIKK